MARIREDVVGVFHTPEGILRAGDTVPESVAMSDFWLAEVEDVADESGADVVEVEGKSEEVEAVEPPAGNASLDDWQKFLAGQGIEFDADKTRNELRDLWGSK